MVSVPIAVPDGRGGQRGDGRGAVWRYLAPWEVGWDNVVGVLFEAKKEGKKGKPPYCLL